MILRIFGLVLASGLVAGAVAACPEPSDGQVDIYPTAGELPENLLRMYVYFPRPMAVSEGTDRVTLLDAKGMPVSGVFLSTNQELWSPDKTRLTLLLDPGRVKSGLVANETLGRAFVPGQRYTLAVSGDALDTQGCALGADTFHKFKVGEPDYDTPDPDEWSLVAPVAGRLDTVSVGLGSPHDHLSLAYRLRIVDASGDVVPGTIALGPDEASWQFRPRSPWREETYSLLIDERLEDLAGNRPGVLFDRPIDSLPETWVRRLDFVPRSPEN